MTGVMRFTYFVHILAGSLGIVSGFIALYATKGLRLHRRVGMVFVCTMLTTSLFGVTMAAVRGVAAAVNIPAALLTAYLVVTALTTVRPALPGSRWLDPALMLVALGVTLASLKSRSRPSPMAACGTGCRRFRLSCLAWSDCWRAQEMFE